MSTGPTPLKNWKAIAAMAENRVIGNGPAIPWHFPEDFKWFKAQTLGNVIVMGRKTFESIGRPLPKRENIIVSRTAQQFENITHYSSLEDITALKTEKTVFICGGAEIYRQALPLCEELLLTHIKGKYEGDILFPAFEQQFSLEETLQENADFKIIRYKNNLLK